LPFYHCCQETLRAKIQLLKRSRQVWAFC